MKLLMIDTSSVVATAAVIDEHSLIGEIIINHEKKHSEKLMTAVDHLLKDARLTIRDMDAFGIVQGPGSFTGLRIGMATVKGLAQALDKPVVGVSALASLAANIPYAGGIVCPILDAQRHRVYTGLFRNDPNNGQEQILPDSEMTIDALIETLSRYQDQPVIILGDAKDKFFDELKAQLPNCIAAADHLSMNRASSAAYLGMQKLLRGETETHLSIAPTYLRASYAEEK